MLNKEKYAKEILDIVCSGDDLGKQNGHLCPCTNIKCSDCDFNTTLCCPEEIRKWANSEYKEPEIDWNKVPVDTPILVWNYDDKNPQKRRHFAYYSEDNNIYAWSDGKTSHTAYNDYNNCTTNWDYAKIAEGVDCSEWYKD